MPATPASLPAALTTVPAVGSLGPAQHRILVAGRAAVLIGQTGEDPIPRLYEVLGSARAGGALMIVLQTAGQAWPEPVRVCRPCCPALTHDEHCLLALVEAVATGNRAGFDAEVSDMIGPDARDCLHAAMVRFVSAFVRARATG